jgi:N-acetylneuraminic acid mutarotase
LPCALRRRALALSFLVLASCSDTSTEPATAGSSAPSSAVALASNTWITRADMPSTERWGLTSAVVTNAAGQSVLYAIGGATITNASLGKVQAYNVSTNSWTYKASLPIAVYSTNGSGVINGKIYVSGGVTKDKVFHRALYMYDPANNVWTRKQDIPSCCGGVWGGMTGVINNQLYVLTCEVQEDCYIDLSSLSLSRYDPVTNQWTSLADSPAQLQHPMGGVIGGKLYVAGLSGVSGDGSHLNVYDPATNQWTPRAPMPRARWGGAGVALGGKLYIIGGYQREPDGSRKRVRTTNVYDPATNTWTTRAPMPTERHDFSASRVVFNGQPRIEVVGGERPGNNLQYIP